MKYTIYILGGVWGVASESDFTLLNCMPFVAELFVQLILCIAL